MNPSIYGSICDLFCAKYQAGISEIEQHLEEMNRDLWAALSDKASREALDKMKSVPQGEDLWAYAEVHLWFCNTSEQGTINRRIVVRNPATCKHECKTASVIES